VRLCFISNPNSTHTRRWVDWFIKQGHQVCLIADDLLLYPWSGLTIYRLPERLNTPVLRYLFWVIWTRHIVRDWEPDILHAHRVSSAGWLGSFTGYHPFVVTPWGSDLYQHPYRSWIVKRLAFFVLKQADMITADSEDLRQQAIRFGAVSDNTYLVQWGVDLNLFNPEGNTHLILNQLGIGDAPVVLSPRGVNPVYNLDIIIKAIPRVRDAIPDVVFVLRDYNTDQAYKQKLLKLIEVLGVARSVRWIERIEPWEYVADLYRMADLVVSVPSSDGTPVSVLEAMACGIPVIVSDLASLREWIKPDENGLLIPVRDATALAEAIIQLLKNPKQQTQFRDLNLQLIREKADHQKEMAKVERLYSRLLTEKVDKNT